MGTGPITKKMDLVYFFTKIRGSFTRGILGTMKNMVLESFGTPKSKFTRVTGAITKRMEKEKFFLKMTRSLEVPF